jgi:uncharacterized protein
MSGQEDEKNESLAGAASDADMSPSLLTRRTLLQGAGAAALLAATAGRAFAESESPEMAAKFAAARAAGHFGPHRIREIETAWVTMRDGVKLALRIILPEDADAHPVPAVMTYQPYRRRDVCRTWDEHTYYYLASHGYAGICPDIRGSGDSEGVLKDEYLQSEQDDAVEIIAWLARQPWCTGKVGMIGISWAGFASLQVAANRPPALKAIITDGFTDNRYTDDAHYIGGCIVQDMFIWGSDFITFQSLPPDPAIVGARWRKMWRQRCDALDFSVANWVRHQTYDAFWKHGSISQNYPAIECPVYAVGGWTDGYPNSVPRVMEHLTVPRKALIGPWGHAYPDVAQPGPNIDWLDEQRRWWDHWLKGIDTGIMKEPAYRAWMAEDAVHSGMKDMPGRWVAEDSWPSPHIQPRVWHLNDRALDANAGASAEMTLRPDHQTVGIASGHWCPAGGGGDLETELPLDQEVDDARSLVFDSEPLTERVEILGFPTVDIDLAVDQPVALLAVRLCEVHPGGTSRKVSYGVLNLTHRDGHEHPEPLEPGKRYRVRVQLKNSGFAFKPGNRIRVSLAAANWYLVWPSPAPVVLTVYTGASTLTLPVRPPRPEDALLRSLGKPFDVPTSRVTVLKPDMLQTKQFLWDVGGSSLTITSEGGGGAQRLDAIGTVGSSKWKGISHIKDDDPTSARITHTQTWEFRRDDWRTRIETQLEVSVTSTDYVLRSVIYTYDDDKLFFTRSWDEKIPRVLS